MTSMNRTAYPRAGKRLTEMELHSRYTLTGQELWFLQVNARGDKGRVPENGKVFVASFRAELTSGAAAVDRGFPGNTSLTIDASGKPHLKQMRADTAPEGMTVFEEETLRRMPERHLLDIPKNTEHWSRYTRHFGPPSGSDPKLAQAVQRYMFAVFGCGCNLSPGQTARHAPDIATSQTLRRITAQHINANKLEAAMTDVINAHASFSLPRHWGPGKAAIAYGTHVPLRENNLLGSRHIRYGGYGGIAYTRRHILRFGRYGLNMEDLSEPLMPTPLPFELAV